MAIQIEKAKVESTQSGLGWASSLPLLLLLLLIFLSPLVYDLMDWLASSLFAR